MKYTTLQPAIWSPLMLITSCVATNRSAMRAGQNPSRELTAGSITFLQFDAVAGEEEHPRISSEKLETIFTLRDKAEIARFLTELKRIPDGQAFVLGCGSMVDVQITGDKTSVLASVSVMWDGVTVMVESGSECFAGKGRDFALYCFKLVNANAHAYLVEVAQGKRPGPPPSGLENIFAERFPCPELLEVVKQRK